jgi:uncharacterized membrane protein (DUF373 family)
VATENNPRESERAARARSMVARGFSWVEDLVYIGLGTLLSIGALVLLGSTAHSLWVEVWQGGSLAAPVVRLLDRLLLVLMIVEVLYTVQVSFRQHAIIPEPFLVIGLVAAVRRLLVITAEFSNLEGRAEPAMRFLMIELGLLTVMVAVLVTSLIMLRREPGAKAVRK